jgi:membrane protease YdiL (CAAX protease family)
MDIQGSFFLYFAFTLLAGAICFVPTAPIQFGSRITIPAWVVLFIGSLVSGLIAGVLHPIAIISLGAFCGVAYLYRASNKTWQSLIFGSVMTVLALALAMHRLPGFNNPITIAATRMSSDASIFSQYANFDKGAVGLILYALICNRMDFAREWRNILKRVLPISLITFFSVLGVAFAIGFVKFDLKFTQVTILFLVTNLFFTVVAEETFFRGFLQDRLANSLVRFRFGELFAVVSSALLFGLAHIGGGATAMFLAVLAGLGNAYAYKVTKRVEAAISVHFLLNTVHFVAFTYPHIN